MWENELSRDVGFMRGVAASSVGASPVTQDGASAKELMGGGESREKVVILTEGVWEQDSSLFWAVYFPAKYAFALLGLIANRNAMPMLVLVTCAIIIRNMSRNTFCRALWPWGT